MVVLMRCLTVLLALAAFGTGLWAAYKWYKASKVEIDLGYHPPGLPGGTFKRLEMDLPRFVEPVDPEMRQSNEIMATWEAMKEAAQLNKEAAIWTAGSVALGALSAVVGVLG